MDCRIAVCPKIGWQPPEVWAFNLPAVQQQLAQAGKAGCLLCKEIAFEGPTLKATTPIAGYFQNAWSRLITTSPHIPMQMGTLYRAVEQLGERREKIGALSGAPRITEQAWIDGESARLGAGITALCATVESASPNAVALRIWAWAAETFLLFGNLTEGVRWATAACVTGYTLSVNDGARQGEIHRAYYLKALSGRAMETAQIIERHSFDQFIATTGTFAQILAALATLTDDLQRDIATELVAIEAEEFQEELASTYQTLKESLLRSAELHMLETPAREDLVRFPAAILPLWPFDVPFPAWYRYADAAFVSAEALRQRISTTLPSTITATYFEILRRELGAVRHAVRMLKDWGYPLSYDLAAVTDAF